MKNRALLSIFLIIISTTTFAKSESKNMIDFYFLNADIEGLAVNVKINGLTVLEELGGSITAQRPINQWLKSGENTVQLNLSSLPDRILTNGGMGKLKIFLHDTSEEFPTPKETLIDITFPNIEIKLDPKQTLIAITKEFIVERPVATRIEKDGVKILSLSEDDKAAIAGLVEQFRSSLMDGNAQKSVELSQYKIEEDALLENKNVSDLQKIAAENYSMISGEQGLTSKSVVKDNLRFESGWGGFVYYVVDRNGEDVVRFETEEFGFEIPVYVAKIKGRWTIVR